MGEKKISNTQDFYQGGRSFGKFISIFLNLGTITDAGQATAVTSEIFRQGLSGVWFQNLVLFHTPFQWFTSALQRRARYLAPADIFLHRFESKTLAGIYASVLIAVAIYSNSFGFLLTGKTLQAIMSKPESEYTLNEKNCVKEFEELKSIKTKDFLTLNKVEKLRLDVLSEKEKKNEIYSFASYLNLNSFYIFYAIIIALYTVIGGLFAVAIIDVIQGLLILFLSIALIPAAFLKLGGFAVLAGKISLDKFNLFGSSPLSDYTWYFVASFAFLNLIVNAPKNFGLGGAAKDDISARIGFVGGAMIKRVMMVGWAITGLFALALYSDKVSDPTNVWGYMAHDLLGAGALGLMIAAIFSANMDGNATVSLDASAAFVKNIFLPIKKNATEKEQMILGRFIVLIVLIPAIFFASYLNDILVVFKYILSIGTITSPAIWLAYFWRKLNTKAVIIQMIISIVLIVLIPNLISKIDSLSTNKFLISQTEVQFVDLKLKASNEDVNLGLAKTVGQVITKKELIPPTPIFFERIVRDNPNDTNSLKHGEGLFKPQIWILSKLGFDFSKMRKSHISTAGFMFDAIFPFIVLILISLFTRKNNVYVLNDFYARINTPAHSDKVLDAKLVQLKIDNPSLVEANKLFSNTDIEIWKPTKEDIIGFILCILFVLMIIGAYSLIASFGGS